MLHNILLFTGVLFINIMVKNCQHWKTISNTPTVRHVHMYSFYDVMNLFVNLHIADLKTNDFEHTI